MFYIRQQSLSRRLVLATASASSVRKTSNQASVIHSIRALATQTCNSPFHVQHRNHATPVRWSSLLKNDSFGGKQSYSTTALRRLGDASASNNADVDAATPSYYTDEQRFVMEECQKLHASIMPINEKLRGPLAPHSDQGTALPFVLLLGNHSSGKSSFINYVLGRNIQTTGVAPTDDAFTIIAPGPNDRDQDGPAVIGDPDLGFGQLRQFGPTLIHHTQLKIRSAINSNFLIVDTPGMIDSPANYSGILNPQAANEQYTSNTTSNSNSNNGSSSMDRGYDFTGVVRWLADRADVVCLFFDPDKPGTTGETLSILLHSLSGMDHKLLIVLNKADQFSKIHDFARAYGSLCWNLSKVIPRKDLPMIYTMCLPEEHHATHGQSTTKKATEQDDSSTNSQDKAALQDLFTAREEVVAQVRKAPARRMDNWITGLHDAVSQLQMHATLLQEIQQRQSKLFWQQKWQEGVLAFSGASLTTLCAMYGMDLLGASGGAVVAALSTSTILGTGGMVWYNALQLQEWKRQSSKRDELFQSFQRTHGRAIEEGDEFVAAVWQRTRSNLALALSQQEREPLGSVSSGDLQQLERILKDDIPRLRRQASPDHYGK